MMSFVNSPTAQRKAQREMCLHSPALTHDSYVAAIQVSRLADHGDSISHHEFWKHGVGNFDVCMRINDCARQVRPDMRAWLSVSHTYIHKSITRRYTDCLWLDASIYAAHWKLKVLHGVWPSLHRPMSSFPPCDDHLYYRPSCRRPCIKNPTMKSTFLARGKTYEVFQPGAKVEVVVVAMSGKEICTIYVTTDAWSLIYKIQKLSESVMPMGGLAKEYLIGDPFFIAFQEEVGGCLRVPSCSIEVRT